MQKFLDREVARTKNTPFDNGVIQERVRRLPPVTVKIRRDVPILESKAVNERRKAERRAAGITKKEGSFQVIGDERLQDPAYYQSMGVEPNLGWDEL